MDKDIKYYKGLETGSIYKLEPITISGQSEKGKRLSRWNWDMQNWSGHIHSFATTRKQIQEGKVIVEITKEEAFQEIG